MTPHPNRWWILTTVVAAQFMFVVDAFIVNVAIPSIRADLQTSAGAIEAVIALYQIAFATLVITGGRLGDLYGRKRLFLLGLLGFTLASVWCGLAGSGAELIVARVAQGASAAMMSPQVLATIHTLFPDAARTRAFAVFGISLGLGGGVGFLVGGWLLALNVAGLGWRMVFFVNAPVGAAIALAATRLLRDRETSSATQLDVTGAAVLFAGLLCLTGPLLAGRELDWAWFLWVMEAGGIAILALFLRLQFATARRGGAPLIDLALLLDGAFLRGLAATACFFAANMSFYLVITLYLQGGLGMAPFRAGLIVLPLSIAFVVASRRGAGAAARLGRRALIRGCVVQLLGLALTGLAIVVEPVPADWLLMLTLAVFGYGQGLVLAPLYGIILASVGHAYAGSGSGILTTTQQIANGGGVAVIGAVYFTTQAAWSDHAAILAALAALGVAVTSTALLLERMRPVASV